MSWKDRLENREFTIKTGDGKIYKPIWKNSEKSKDFNISKYDFIDVEKSFIDRKKPQSNKYPLTFYFQGDDNIEQCDEFEKSADDNRMWNIEHPFYGSIKGQPTNLKRNDSNYNVTEVTVEFWESIVDDYPVSQVSIRDTVSSKVSVLNAAALAMMVENTEPITSDITFVKISIDEISSRQEPDSMSFNDYRNLVKKALSSADKLVSDPLTSLSDAQSIISEPAKFNTSVFDRIDSFVKAYYSMKESIDGLFDKYYFESQSATLVSSICQCLVNPLDSDYITRNDIESANEQLTEIYKDYLDTIDNAQVSIYDIDNSWSPNSEIQSNLLGLVAYTSRSLFALSFDARQERLFELDKDSNIIILTHRFLGLDAEDKNLDTFRRINNIKNRELYKIKKGRTIKYFI